MKLSKLKSKLKNENQFIGEKDNSKLLSPLSYDNNFEENNTDLDNIKIVGVTGSKGKSTICYLVHEYLKAIGKKSILYSSIFIDSEKSNKNKTSIDVPLSNEKSILDFIEESEKYGNEYLVLEVNESSIEKGLVDDIPFNIRALSNIYPKNSSSMYEDDEYINLKKKFFKDIDNETECTCVLGMCDPLTREDFNELILLNKCEKVTYGSKYFCEYRNANYNNLDYLIYSENNTPISSVNGLNFKMRIKDEIHDIKTKMIMPFVATDIACVVAILDSLGVLDMNVFKEFIMNVDIEGRDEVIKIRDRIFVIGISLMPHLEIFKSFKTNKEIAKIKLLMGTAGNDFVTWDKSHLGLKRISNLPKIKKAAIEYSSKYCDYIYLTSNDPASSNPKMLVKDLTCYLKDRQKYEVIIDRKEAIRKLVLNSEEGDLIYISGRGNRNTFCKSYDEMEVFTDKEVLVEVLEELGWM